MIGKIEPQGTNRTTRPGLVGAGAKKSRKRGTERWRTEHTNNIHLRCTLEAYYIDAKDRVKAHWSGLGMEQGPSL